MSNSNRYGQHYKNDKNKAKEFEITKEPQRLYAEILLFSANSPREYRFNISRDLWELCKKLIYQVRIANNTLLGSMARIKNQQKCIKTLLKINDLLPVYSMCRCISLGQEAAFAKRLNNYRFSFRKWLESDMNRLKGDKFADMRKILEKMMDNVLVISSN